MDETGWEGLSDKELIVTRQHAQELAAGYQRIVTGIEGELVRRMSERNARGIPDDEYKVELVESGVSYAPERLKPLLEVLHSDDLAECYTPPRSDYEWIERPEKWNVTKLKPIAKLYGKDVQEKLDAARIGGRLTLKVEKRKKKEG